ncbi:hypothetical protein VPH35_038533 [Triticum aestivum]|uniref:Uncharacterized protein n=1 Tax=Aegilops tauschii TaxID=37682 RepID=R7W967_AEGTA
MAHQGKLKEDGAFLPWLRSKAGSAISSALRIGSSPLGREQSREVTVSGLVVPQVLVRVAADPGGDCTGSAIAKEPHSTGSTSSSSSGRQRLPQLRPPQLWSPLHLCLLLRLPGELRLLPPLLAAVRAN